MELQFPRRRHGLIQFGVPRATGEFLMKGKPVITISERELPGMVDELVTRVLEDGFTPDVTIGIATGGAMVANQIDPAIAGVRFTCTVQRPQTRLRSGIPGLHAVLRRLPPALADLLRVAEDWVGTHVTQASSPRAVAGALDPILEAIREQGVSRILVVDDAVDSGATLSGVVTAIRSGVPEATWIRTCAITSTRGPEKALIVPDYVLFERTLCRFHWSSDYREVQ